MTDSKKKKKKKSRWRARPADDGQPPPRSGWANVHPSRCRPWRRCRGERGIGGGIKGKTRRNGKLFFCLCSTTKEEIFFRFFFYFSGEVKECKDEARKGVSRVVAAEEHSKNRTEHN